MTLHRSEFLRYVAGSFAGLLIVTPRAHAADNEIQGAVSGNGFLLGSVKLDKHGSPPHVMQMSVFQQQTDPRGRTYWRALSSTKPLHAPGTYNTDQIKVRGGGTFAIRFTGRSCSYQLRMGFRDENRNKYKIIAETSGNI